MPTRTKLTKMKPSIRDRWIKALRSGKYEQTTGTLCHFDSASSEPISYCCLGVLTHILKDPNGDLGNCSLLSEEILKKTGLTNPVQEKLANLNDDSKWSFNRIASYIERYL